MGKAKTFSKIWSAGQVKKGLLSDDFDNIPETPDQSGTGGDFDDDDDFPIEFACPNYALHKETVLPDATGVNIQLAAL